jgi:predicted DNA-binding transcriptional regulator AlpA
MQNFSTRQAAKKLGISMASLSRYVADGKVPAPNPVVIGRYEVRAWTEADIERVRVILPKIANGRKTRHQKQRKKQTKRKPTP